MSVAAHQLKHTKHVTPTTPLPVLSGATGRLDSIQAGNTWFGKHEHVYCVFRILSGSPNTASLLDEIGDGNHTTGNVTSVTLSSTGATVTFDKTFSGIGMVGAGPDEQYCGRYLVGVTPGTSSVFLTFTKTDGTAVNPLTEAFTTSTYTNSNWWVVGVMPAT